MKNENVFVIGLLLVLAVVATGVMTYEPGMKVFDTCLENCVSETGKVQWWVNPISVCSQYCSEGW